MLPNSLRIRAVHFAFLFGPPRFVGREEASKVHGSVCDALGIDDLTFRYSSPSVPETPYSKGFSIVMRREEGRGSFEATIDNKSVNEPIRLVLAYTWPPSLEDAKQTCDITAEAALPSLLDGRWERVVAEVRLRAQCDTRKRDGLAFLKQSLLGQAQEWVLGLGDPLAFCGAKFEVAAAPPGDDPLAGPKRELLIEVLREDPCGVYLELMCQWPQIAAMTRGQAPVVALRSIRQIDRKPSEYMGEAYSYLEDRVKSLASSGGAQ